MLLLLKLILILFQYQLCKAFEKRIIISPKFIKLAISILLLPELILIFFQFELHLFISVFYKLSYISYYQLSNAFTFFAKKKNSKAIFFTLGYKQKLGYINH